MYQSLFGPCETRRFDDSEMEQSSEPCIAGDALPCGDKKRRENERLYYASFDLGKKNSMRIGNL